MAMRIAIANLKGGVGKSTTALMIAEGLAYYAGARVLAVDLDPQTSLSSMLLSRTGADAAAAHGRSLSYLLECLVAQKVPHLGGLISNKASDVVELREAHDHRRVDLIASDRQLLARLSALEVSLRDLYD
jgi:cellulose biosynthesis protein BcsQ